MRLETLGNTPVCDCLAFICRHLNYCISGSFASLVKRMMTIQIGIFDDGLLDMTMAHYRRNLLFSIGFIVPFGLITKFYRGTGQAWLNDAFGGIPYEVFWILLVAWIWPRTRPAAIAFSVFGATCLLEFLQLWQPAWLQAIRATLPGRLVLGNTFVWSDFSYYAIGCVIGWLWLRCLHPKAANITSET